MTHHLTRLIPEMGGKERGWYRVVCCCGWKHWCLIKDRAGAEAVAKQHLADVAPAHTRACVAGEIDVECPCEATPAKYDGHASMDEWLDRVLDKNNRV